MGYDTVSACIIAVIDVAVEHEPRGFHTDNAANGIQGEIPVIGLHRYQLQCQFQLSVLAEVLELGIGIDTCKKKRQAGAYQLVIQIQQPDIALVVDTHIVDLL